MMNENEEMIFEAAYLLTHYGSRSEIRDQEIIFNALWRILTVAGIKNNAGAEKYLKDHSHTTFIEDSEALFRAVCKEKKSFFNDLSPEELFVYHGANFDVSFTYGLNLAKAINFKNKKIADVGGSTGGLLSGIKQVYRNAACTVFDLASTCQIAEELDITEKTQVIFQKGDFFKGPFLQEYYDYVILSNVLHDWQDQDSLTILQNISPLISARTKVIIYEDVIFDSGLEPADTIMYGLRLAVHVPGGRQRMIHEYERLFKAAWQNYRQIGRIVHFDRHSALIVDFV